MKLKQEPNLQMYRAIVFQVYVQNLGSVVRLSEQIDQGIIQRCLIILRIIYPFNLT